MKKKTSTKMLKVTSVVLAVEAVAVLILLVVILTGNWQPGEKVDNPGSRESVESSVVNKDDDPQAEQSKVEDQEESNSVSDETENESKSDTEQQESKSEVQTDQYQESESVEESDAFIPESADSEVAEESITQNNWGEIDWN